MDVCNSTFDTKLWVGTGCPGGTSATFGCSPASADDDAPGCGPTNFGSRVTFTPPAGTLVIYAVVGGTIGVASTDYTLRWRVGGASWVTPSASATPTVSHTGTHSPTTSRTATRSAAATHSPTQTRAPSRSSTASRKAK